MRALGRHAVDARRRSPRYRGRTRARARRWDERIFPRARVPSWSRNHAAEGCDRAAEGLDGDEGGEERAPVG